MSGERLPAATPGARFQEALQFAAELHRNQRRKDGRTPYVAHLMAVCALVLEDGGSEDEAIAALLHDSLEDQGDAFPGGRKALSTEISSRFGEAVLAIVVACTDDLDAGSRLSEDHARKSWHERKRRFVESLPNASESALRVIAADKLHNASRLVEDLRLHGSSVWKRFHVSDEDAQLAYYRKLRDALAEHLPGELSTRLWRAVREMQTEAERARTGKAGKQS